MPDSQQTRRLTMAITELDVGGAEKAFVQVACGLKSIGWEVRVISVRDAGLLANALKTAGIPVTPLNAGRFPDVRAIWRMSSELKRNPCDILLTFLHQANIVGRIAGRLAGVQQIISGVRVADRRWSVIIPERLTWRMVDRYVSVSNSVAHVHQKVCRIADDRMTVIPNGVDGDAIQAALPADRRTLQWGERDKIILCVGRLSKQKAPLDMLEAFEFVRSNPRLSGFPVRLVYVGDGPLRKELEQRIREKALQNEVRILGWRSDVWSLMKAADMLVLPSHWEGLPNVILEAQAVGLPVAASDVDGCKELIEDRRTGRLFPPGDTQRLAEVVAEVLTFDAEIQESSRLAREKVQANHQWVQCIMKYDELLKWTGTVRK